MAKRPIYYVDLPNSNDPTDSWVCQGTFTTRKAAIKYCQEMFGADEQGRIGLVSKAEAD